jgi:hypothetical protein
LIFVWSRLSGIGFVLNSNYGVTGFVASMMWNPGDGLLYYGPTSTAVTGTLSRCSATTISAGSTTGPFTVTGQNGLMVDRVNNVNMLYIPAGVATQSGAGAAAVWSTGGGAICTATQSIWDPWMNGQ